MSCMKRQKILILLPLLFIGCNPAKVYIDRPVVVKVPVPVPCPEPPKVPRPVIKPLPPNATHEQVTEAALRAMLEVMGYADQLEVILDSYRKPEVKK